MNIHVSFFIMVFSGSMPRSGIVAYGSFIPSFLRNLHTVAVPIYISMRLFEENQRQVTLY